VEELTPSSQENLQFERAEPTGGEAAEAFQCSFCSTPLYSSYYDINNRPACEACRYKIEQEAAAGAGPRGFLRAALAGFGAAAAGSALYYGVRALTGYEIGFVAIIVGLMVGVAVRWGTRGKGGRSYQFLAVFLTYMSISSTYAPMILEAIREKGHVKKPAAAPAAAAAVAPSTGATVGTKQGKPEGDFKWSWSLFFLGLFGLFLIAAAGPVLAAFESPIVLLIVGFGLWQAWKINRRAALEIVGPLTVGA
jgi:hypothetical protein